MEYTREQFIEDVKKEAIALRKYATVEELMNLDFTTLEADDIHSCIYGQATGSCLSERACELIEQCCSRFIYNHIFLQESSFVEIAQNVTDTNVSVYKRHLKDGIRYLSSIEAYITWVGAKNENLIAYLRGETNELNL